MKCFMTNWNYKKHAVAVSGVYLGITVIGNLLLRQKDTPKKGLPCSSDQKKVRTQKSLFHGILAVMYGVDMTLGYIAMKKLDKCLKKD